MSVSGGLQSADVTDAAIETIRNAPLCDTEVLLDRLHHGAECCCAGFKEYGVAADVVCARRDDRR